MEKANFTAWAALAVGDPSGGDHVSVESNDGGEWGCFGDTPASMRNEGRNPKICAQGNGYTGWASLVNDNDNAGVAYGSGGRCHNVANRIMVLAGDEDVRSARADALLMFVYGKYGFNVSDFIQRIKSTAQQFNAANNNILTQQEIDAVIAKIGQAKQDELEILEQYFQQNLQPKGLQMPPDQMAGLAAIYGDYFDKRAALESDPANYQRNIKPVILDSLTKVQNLIGNDQYQIIFKLLPPFATQVLESQN